MFRIEGIYHLTQVVAERTSAESFLATVLGAEFIFRNHASEAARDASFWDVAGIVVEVMSPASTPGAEAAATGRFLNRFGERMHSCSWWTDDLRSCVDTLIDAGVRCFTTAGAEFMRADAVPANDGIWTHPKDTQGMHGFVGRDCTPELRRAPQSAHSSDPRGPLGIVGFDRVIILVADPAAAASAFSAWCGARTRQVGPSVFAEVDTACVEYRSGTSLADGNDWLSRNGDGPISAALLVEDIAVTKAALAELKIGFDSSDAWTVRLRPTHAAGVPWELTTRSHRA